MLEPFWERSKCCFLRSESQDGVHPATDLAKARPTLGGRYLVDTFEPSNGRRKLCGIQALIRRLPFCGLSLSENGYKDREANDEGAGCAAFLAAMGRHVHRGMSIFHLMKFGGEVALAV